MFGPQISTVKHQTFAFCPTLLVLEAIFQFSLSDHNRKKGNNLIIPSMENVLLISVENYTADSVEGGGGIMEIIEYT